jgi:hypothetical protein
VSSCTVKLSKCLSGPGVNISTTAPVPLANATKIMRSDLGIFLKKAASSLTLYGNMKEATKRIDHIRRQGVTAVIGLPIKENEQ